ncbi:MAG: ParA family protein [Clostridia bacterium]|nr:ParA family protein [Clostridia bacterium]
MQQLERIILVCGHYGCGKTNLSINLALQYAAAGEKVTLVDLDIVNPYFRSSDYPQLLKEHGVELIAPTYAHSNVDLPSLPTEMYSVFTREGRIIIDVGGDDAGATALGRFAPQLGKMKYSMLYVINMYRVMSETPDETVQLLREIEAASRMKATGIVNNSHVMNLTTVDDILKTVEYTAEVSGLTGLPVVATAVNKKLCSGLFGVPGEIYPVEVYVKTPWSDSENVN